MNPGRKQTAVILIRLEMLSLMRFHGVWMSVNGRERLTGKRF